jgi:hypothetical protein
VQIQAFEDVEEDIVRERTEPIFFFFSLTFLNNDKVQVKNKAKKSTVHMQEYFLV